MALTLISRWGEPATWPRDPEKVLLGLDAFIERNLLEPAGESQERRVSVRTTRNSSFPAAISIAWPERRRRGWCGFCAWAQNPLIKRVNMAFVLVADKLAEVNERLVQSPHVATIEIPLAGRRRARAIRAVRHGSRRSQSLVDLGGAQLAEVSNGLELTNLDVVLTQAARSGKSSTDSLSRS